jgi:hypothetical protein
VASQKKPRTNKPLWKKKWPYVILILLVFNYILASNMLFRARVGALYNESVTLDESIKSATSAAYKPALTMPPRYDELVQESVGLSQSILFVGKTDDAEALARLLREKYNQNTDIVANHNARGSATSVWGMMVYDKDCFKKWPKECMTAFERFGAAAKPYTTKMDNAKEKNAETNKEIEDKFLFLVAK